MRLFFALELPAAVRAALGRLRPPAGSPGAAAYRWVEPDLLHVSLVFLGEQPADALPALRRAAEAAAASGQPATLGLGEPGAFGPRHAPRVLWVGLDGGLDALAALQAALADRLRGAGFALEERTFAPHITLARRRAGATPDDRLAWPPPRPAGPRFEMRELSLMRSQLSPAGPTYTALERVPLGPPGPARVR